MNGVATRQKKILIVEDDKEMQEMYRMIFSEHKESYDIDIEGEAHNALRILPEKSYNLVILDILMDPIPGDTFFVITRSYKKTQTIPILVVSVLAEDALSNLKKINHVEFLQKPITAEQLISKVKKMAS